MPTSRVRLPTGDEEPLLALGGGVLVAGCATVLRSYGVADRTGALEPLAELRVPAGGARFASVAIAPDARVLAALLSGVPHLHARRRATHPPALLLITPADMAFAGRIELPHLPTASRAVPMAVVTDGPRVAVVLPSLLLELDPVNFHVLRRVVLEVPAGVPPALPSSPCMGDVPGLICYNYEAVDARSVHAVQSLQKPGCGQYGIAVLYASGEFALFSSLSRVASTTSSGDTDSANVGCHASAAPLLSYTGDRYLILDVVGISFDTGDSSFGRGLFAVALVQDRGDAGFRCDGNILLAEDVVEPTLPQVPWPQWAIIVGNGENSCFPIEDINELKTSFTPEDLPLKCVANTCSSVAVLCRSGRVLLLDVNRKPSVVASCCLLANTEMSGRSVSPVVAASPCAESRWRFAVMYESPGKAANPFTARSYSIGLLETPCGLFGMARGTPPSDSAETIPPTPSGG